MKTRLGDHSLRRKKLKQEITRNNIDGTGKRRKKLIFVTIFHVDTIKYKQENRTEPTLLGYISCFETCDRLAKMQSKLNY